MKFFPFYWLNGKGLVLGSFIVTILFSIFWYFDGQEQEPIMWLLVIVINLIYIAGMYISWKKRKF